MVHLRRPPEWGVEPVPPSLRVLRTFDLFVLWSSLGVGLLVLAAGTLLIGVGGFGFGLTLAESAVVAFVGSVLGSVMLAAAAHHGSRAGVPTMVSLRPILGRRGSYIPTARNVFQLFGWAAFERRVLGIAAATLVRFESRDGCRLHDREHTVLHARRRADGAWNRPGAAELSGGDRLTGARCVPALHHPRGRDGQRVREHLFDRGLHPKPRAEATPAHIHRRRDRRRDGRRRVPLEPRRGAWRRIRRVPVPDRRPVRAPPRGRHRGLVRRASGVVRSERVLRGRATLAMVCVRELDPGCGFVFRDCGLCAPDRRDPALIRSGGRAPHSAFPSGIGANEADVSGGERRSVNLANGPALRTPRPRRPAAAGRPSRRSGCTWSEDAANQTVWASDHAVYSFPFVGSTARAGKTLFSAVLTGALKTIVGFQVWPSSTLRETTMLLKFALVAFWWPPCPGA